MAVVVLTFFICFIAYMWWEAHRNRIVAVELAFSDFPESVRALTIFFISDIHRRKVSQELIEQVKGKADFVIIGGDLTETGVPFSRVRENVKRLKQVGPVYFVWGNNDYETDYHELDALLLQEGVHILDNRAALFESEQGEKVALIGVDDVGKRRARLDIALSDADEEAFRILACHNPKIVHAIRPENRIALVVSGHTHGGQIRLGRFGLYEKGGIKQQNGTTVFVSNGYGTRHLPLRLGAKAEANLITIRRKEGQGR
ncbi:metallophosphoesterase [Anoxybacteroides tepidamans]|uniref:metallophosphoesterase n=1 Tax=Anoxybacteroides tepidamans TaxID=265948 RepID=UPI000487E4F3|nr:metallophosphoesterase [Anoxybacillus tepidamans]